jgi:Icc-related predicted phosphoesterase
VIRVAAAADIHCRPECAGEFRPYFEQAARDADLLLLGGDLTSWGLPAEAETLARELAGLQCPIVAVLGNHDLHSDQGDCVRYVLEQGGITVLEGESAHLRIRGESLTVVGAKGFGGGFGRHCLAPFGEHEIKEFVRATRRCADALSAELARARATYCIVLLHYSPVADTLRGEPEQIYPFLGSSILAEAVDSRVCADLVLHGHAHNGSPAGVTPGGVQVRNVAIPVIKRPYVVFELEHAPAALTSA